MQLIETRPPGPGAQDGQTSAETAVRANRYDVVSRLADDLAHEIKNPLNAIVVNLEVMRRRIENGNAEAALDRTSVIEHEVRRVHGLVDQLLQLLRPARSQHDPIAVDGLIEALATAVQLQAKAARVTLNYTAESSLYAQIRPEAFKFALLNLLTVAIDAEAPAGGSVSIAAQRGNNAIDVVVNCSTAILSDTDERMQFCRMLMEAAGGTLASLEPQSGGAGSTVTLVMPPGRFG